MVALQYTSTALTQHTRLRNWCATNSLPHPLPSMIFGFSPVNSIGNRGNQHLKKYAAQTTLVKEMEASGIESCRMLSFRGTRLYSDVAYPSHFVHATTAAPSFIVSCKGFLGCGFSTSGVCSSLKLSLLNCRQLRSGRLVVSSCASCHRQQFMLL